MKRQRPGTGSSGPDREGIAVLAGDSLATNELRKQCCGQHAHAKTLLSKEEGLQ